MKKFLLFSLLVTFGLLTGAQAQEKNDADLSHWSVNAKAGLNLFRVLPVGSGIFNSLGYQAGGTLEYTFNPLFGVGGELELLTFNRSTAGSKTLDATVFASLNATNLLLKERTGFWNNLNLYTNIGAGLHYFSSNVYVPVKNTRGISAVVPTTILAEVRLSKSLTLGAEAQYRFYLNEAIGGLPVNGLSTDAFVGSVKVGYKLGAVNKTHVKNMTVADYYPQPAPVIVEKIVEKAVISDAELNRFKALEEKNAALEAEQAKIKSKLGEVKTSSSILEERTALNNAEIKRIKAVEDMNVLLLAEVGKIKAIEDKNAALEAEVAAIKAAEPKTVENKVVEVVGLDKIAALEEKNAQLVAEQTQLKNQVAELVSRPVILPEDKAIEVVGLNKINSLEEKNAQLAAEQVDLRDQIAELKARPVAAAEVKTVQVINDADVKRIKALEVDNEQLKAQIECMKKAIEESKVVEVPEVKSVDTVIVVKETVPAIAEGDLNRIKALEEKNAQLESDVEKLKELLTEMKEKAKCAKEAEHKECAKATEVKECAKPAEAKPCVKDSVPVAPAAVETVKPVVVAPVAAEPKVDLKVLAATVKFKFNSNELEASSLESLNKVAEVMKATPAMKIKVSGYTDNIGSAEVNKALSQKRADVVKAYIVSKGATAKNITAVGEGPAKPVASNDTAEGRAKNRRVEIEVVK